MERGGRGEDEEGEGGDQEREVCVGGGGGGGGVGGKEREGVDSLHRFWLKEHIHCRLSRVRGSG